VEVSEAFALRLQELTGCLIADRRNGRLIEPGALSQEKPVDVQEQRAPTVGPDFPRKIRDGERRRTHR
jgi:hypothetical protein